MDGNTFIRGLFELVFRNRMISSREYTPGKHQKPAPVPKRHLRVGRKRGSPGTPCRRVRATGHNSYSALDMIVDMRLRGDYVNALYHLNEVLKAYPDDRRYKAEVRKVSAAMSAIQT